MASRHLSGKGREVISEPHSVFFFGCAWVFIAAYGLCVVTLQGFLLVARGLSSCLAALRHVGSLFPVPQPGIEPASPALLGRFLSTGSPGKSQASCFAGRGEVWQTEEGRAALVQCVRPPFPHLVVLLLRMLINCLCPLCVLRVLTSSSMYEPGSVAQ